MAVERQRPDGETFVLTELTGAYTDVDDDLDSPDANWLTASGNNVNISCLASFPAPTGNPTVGADLQEFRVLFRQYDEGQTGTPQGQIGLYEGGALIRAGTLTDIPTGGVVLNFTWNANELSGADGSAVECYCNGKKSGGSPSKRNTCEIGAIEWNVTYDIGGQHYSQSASVVIGTTATASRAISVVRSSTIIQGIVAIASRVVNIRRSTYD